jgi:hypothetical protein
MQGDQATAMNCLPQKKEHLEAEQATFASNVAQHLPYLKRMVCSLTGNDSNADDVVQQTILKSAGPCRSVSIRIDPKDVANVDRKERASPALQKQMANVFCPIDTGSLGERPIASNRFRERELRGERAGGAHPAGCLAAAKIISMRS